MLHQNPQSVITWYLARCSQCWHATLNTASVSKQFTQGNYTILNQSLFQRSALNYDQLQCKGDTMLQFYLASGDTERGVPLM